MRSDDRGPSSGSLWLLWVIPMALSLIGIVMIASLSLRNTPAGGNPYGLTLKQIQYLGLGMTAMLCCYLTPLGLLRRTGWLLWMLAVLLTMGTLIPGLGVRVGGARRWLELGSARFQPLELLTIAVPLFLADRLALTNRKDLKAFLSPTLFIALVSVLPLLLQPNLGGTILVLVICLSMHVENRGWKYPLLGGGLLAVLFVFLIWMEPYRTRRFWAFLDPWEDPMGKGFQIIQGLVAFCNGGFLGVGIAKGLQESDYLPAAETDYIFPAIGEEFGLVGTLFILGLYAIWCLRVYSLYRRTSDPYLSSLIWGMAISVLAPMFINLSGVMKLMPLTGIPLPFVSAGGSSLLFMWGKIGILMLINKSLIKSQERRVG